jgi:hypothetical protein
MSRARTWRSNTAGRKVNSTNCRRWRKNWFAEPPHLKGLSVAVTSHFALTAGHAGSSLVVLSRFSHGMGVRLAPGSVSKPPLVSQPVVGSTGEAIMANIVNEFLLFSCLAALVAGVVVAAATLFI